MFKDMNNSSKKDLLKKESYFYELPEELIAQHPEEKRDMSRLLVCGRDGSISHKHFCDIIDYFDKGDVLVINRSKVIPARIFLRSQNAETDYECLILRDKSTGDYHGEALWECIVHPGKKFKPGKIFFAKNDPSVRISVEEVLENGNRIVKFIYDEKENFFSLLDRIGEAPLPPYIKEKPDDPSRYQTVYATKEGSAAAPTAGLHFTKELLEKLEEKGVIIADVLLHVGLGTFRPVKEEDITAHIMHSEHYEISGETAEKINTAKKNGKRVFAVGTTSTRTLEGAFVKEGAVKESSGETNIFIYPGYKLNVVDCLITNFHLPESTLIMLVCAILGYDRTMAAYAEAVKERYRFFSFGDAMLIL